MLVAAIRAATRAELGTHGYAGVTFEGVARRVGTSKPVLYRRYRNRAHLVADALFDDPLPQPATAECRALHEDLIRVLGDSLAARAQIGSDTLRALLGDADLTLRTELVERARRHLLEALRGVVTAAVDRGELGAGAIPDAVLLTPIALIHADLMAAQRSSDPDFLTQVVGTVALPLLRAHAGPGPAGPGGPAS